MFLFSNKIIIRSSIETGEIVVFAAELVEGNRGGLISMGGVVPMGGCLVIGIGEKS